MKKVVNIVIENDGYLIRNNTEECEYTRVMPQGILRIPGIPFYNTAWKQAGEDLKPVVTDLVDVVNSQYRKVSNASAMVAYPADATDADKAMIRQTMEFAGFKTVAMISKTAVLGAEGIENYIAISASERLVILEWYRSGEPTECKYYNKLAVGRRRLLDDIESIQKRHPGAPLRVYVFDACNELGGLYDVGKVVNGVKTVWLLDKCAAVTFKLRKKNIKPLDESAEAVNMPVVSIAKEENESVENPAAEAPDNGKQP